MGKECDESCTASRPMSPDMAPWPSSIHTHTHTHTTPQQIDFHQILINRDFNQSPSEPSRRQALETLHCPASVNSLLCCRVSSRHTQGWSEDQEALRQQQVSGHSGE